MDRLATEDAEQLFALIDAIYAAAVDQDGWTPALAGINDLVGGELTFLVHGIFNPQPSLSGICEAGEVRGRWGDYAAASTLDPKNGLLLRSPAHHVFSDYDFITEAAIDRDPFYQKMYFPDGLRYTVGAKLDGGGDEFSMLAVLRHSERGHVDSRERLIIGLLSRHLSRAGAVARIVGREGAQWSNFLELINYLPEPMFLLAGDGQFMAANRKGESLLARDCGLKVWRRYLICEDTKGNSILRDVIARAARRQAGPNAGMPDLLQCKDSARPFSLLALPLTDHRRQSVVPDFPNRNLVLLIVGLSDGLPETNAQRIQVLFQLTPAESRLLLALSRGADLAAYAEEANLRIGTVRWTLKQILAKTDCHRQSDLMRLLSSLTVTAGLN